MGASEERFPSRAGDDVRVGVSYSTSLLRRRQPHAAAATSQAPCLSPLAPYAQTLPWIHFLSYMMPSLRLP